MNNNPSNHISLLRTMNRNNPECFKKIFGDSFDFHWCDVNGIDYCPFYVEDPEVCGDREGLGLWDASFFFDSEDRPTLIGSMYPCGHPYQVTITLNDDGTTHSHKIERLGNREVNLDRVKSWESALPNMKFLGINWNCSEDGKDNLVEMFQVDSREFGLAVPM